MSELVLEAGKTYVFKDEESKEEYILSSPTNSYNRQRFYNEGFKIEEVDFYGGGYIGDSYVIGTWEKKYFKLKEENDMKEFTKDMLIAGKHICETRGGERYMVMIGDDGLFMSDPSSRCAWMVLDEDYTQDLLCKEADAEKFDIMKICTTSMTSFRNWSGLSLVWERKELTEQQKKILELEETINKAQEQIKKLKGEHNV